MSAIAKTSIFIVCFVSAQRLVTKIFKLCGKEVFKYFKLHFNSIELIIINSKVVLLLTERLSVPSEVSSEFDTSSVYGNAFSTETSSKQRRRTKVTKLIENHVN